MRPHSLLRVAQDNSQDWQTIKSKHGVVLQRNKRRLFTKDDAPFYRATWSVPFDPKLTLQVRGVPHRLQSGAGCCEDPPAIDSFMWRERASTRVRVRERACVCPGGHL